MALILFLVIFKKNFKKIITKNYFNHPVVSKRNWQYFLHWLFCTAFLNNRLILSDLHCFFFKRMINKKVSARANLFHKVLVISSILSYTLHSMIYSSGLNYEETIDPVSWKSKIILILLQIFNHYKWLKSKYIIWKGSRFINVCLNLCRTSCSAIEEREKRGILMVNIILF